MLASSPTHPGRRPWPRRGSLPRSAAGVCGCSFQLDSLRVVVRVRHVGGAASWGLAWGRAGGLGIIWATVFGIVWGLALRRILCLVWRVANRCILTPCFGLRLASRWHRRLLHFILSIVLPTIPGINLTRFLSIPSRYAKLLSVLLRTTSHSFPLATIHTWPTLMRVRHRQPSRFHLRNF